MTEELNQIDNEIETEEEDTSLADDIAKIKATEEKVEEQEDDVEEAEEIEEAPKEEPDVDKEEEERLAKAREDYKKRQEERRKAAEQQAVYEKKAVEATEDSDKQAIEYFKKLQKQQEFEGKIKQAEVELTNLEGEFKVAYPDYEDKVNQAIKLTKYRLIEEGYSEARAEAELKREKVLLADRAAAQGKDPVEAVYNEANKILKIFEKFAEENGYTKGKKKTNLQALREAAKPNAMSGGAGKGATAARKTFDDMEGDEVDELSIGQLLNGVE